jgi:hypothetical protein
MKEVPPSPTPPESNATRSRGLSLARVWPVFVFAGVAYLIAGAAKFIVHQSEGGLFIGCGVAFLVLAWISKPKDGNSRSTER